LRLLFSIEVLTFKQRVKPLLALPQPAFLFVDPTSSTTFQITVENRDYHYLPNFEIGGENRIYLYLPEVTENYF